MSSNRKYPASATASTNRKFSVSQESTSSATAATGAFVEIDSVLDATVFSADRTETRSADCGASRAADCGRSGFSGTFARGSGLPWDAALPPGVGPGEEIESSVQGIKTRFVATPEWADCSCRRALVNCCTLPSPKTTLPECLCWAAVQPTVTWVVNTSNPLPTGTPFVIRLRSPASRDCGKVSVASAPTK